MKFRVAALAAVVAGTLAIAGCGNGAALKAATDSLEACNKGRSEDATKIADLTKQVETLKAAAAATPAATPSPEPTKGGKTGGKATPTPKTGATTPAAAATTAAPAATKTPVPVKLPGIKTK